MPRTSSRPRLLLCLCLITTPTLGAETPMQSADPPPQRTAREDCLLHALHSASDETSAASLRQRCDESGEAQAVTFGQPGSLVVERIRRERAVADNPSVLLAHRRNYLMPLTYASNPNTAPYAALGVDDDRGNLKHAEAQFQISLKAPLAEGLLSEHDALYAGFTARSFWQVYNRDISAPFRETNYEPELFWITPVPWRILGGDATALIVGFSHQSNGRSQPFSRSWNRIYANLIWERSRFVFSFKPWWRLPEDEKSDPSEASGDDNPDIEDFMGNFEFNAVYRRHDHEYGLLLRNNLDSGDNRGAVQLEWTFPLHRRLRGYAQYFDGYGESLIDYNTRIRRVGIGILLSDLF